MLDRAMSVCPVSISGSSAEHFGFRGGQACRTIACFPGVVGSLGDDGSQYAAGAGREVEERGKPADWARAAVGQLGNRSCGPARIITRFLPAGGFLEQAKRLHAAGLPSSRDVGATSNACG